MTIRDDLNGEWPVAWADPLSYARNTRPDDDAEACGICNVVFNEGDDCLTDIDLGSVHADCCGPEREGYVNLETGEPIGPNDPIPAPWKWVGQTARDIETSAAGDFPSSENEPKVLQGGEEQ